MSSLEDRLRDAYLSEAGTVTPECVHRLSAAITAGPRSRRTIWPARWVRLLAPLGAAAAVTAIVVLATVVLPQARGQHNDQPGGVTGSASAPKFLIITTGAPQLEVRGAATGALVARITLPVGSQPPAGQPAPPASRTYIGSVATRNGDDYLVTVYRLNPCRSWLYQFQLNGQGQPTAVTPFAALPTVKGELYSLAVSGDGRMVAYATSDCLTAKPQQSHVAVTNVLTRQTRQWIIWSTDSVDSVSLTANGGLLCYSLQESPSVVRVIPTSAASGPATARGRTVIRAAQFGGPGWISFAAITPDGHDIYFTTYSESPQNGDASWDGQVRMLDLATGQSRIVHTPAGQPGLITAGPSVRDLLLQTQSDARQPLKLAQLDLVTGTLTDLPSNWLDQAGDEITW